MNDRPTPTAQSAFEARLTSAFAAYADRAPVEVDVVTLTALVTRGGAVRRNPFAGERRYLVPVLLGLLLIALAAAVIGVGSSLLRAPSLPAPRSGYDGLVIRPVSDGPLADLDVIAVRTDGQEQVVRRLTSADLPGSWSFTGGAKASRDGWVAMLTSAPSEPGAERPTQRAWALFDLADPARQPRMVPMDELGAWGSDHLFATSVSGIDNIVVIDADTGTTTPVGGLSLPGGGPDIVWTEDGSGIVWRRSDDRYAIRPIDGGPPTEIPALAFARGSRYIAAGGASLEYEAGETTDPVDPERPADLVPPGTVRVLDAAGTPTTWYRGELEPSRLLDASFSADGRSIWLLLERMDGTHHLADVAKLDAPGQAKVITSTDLGEGVAWLWFESFAPDDSAIAIGHWTGRLGTDSTPGETTPGPMTVMWMNGPTTSAHAGDLAGFVPAAVIDALSAKSVTVSPTATPAPPADEPCAAMTHLRFPDVPRANSRDPIPAVGPFTGNGELLVWSNTDARIGGTGIQRFDPSQSPPSPVDASGGVGLALQAAPVSSSVTQGAPMVVSPDGRAIAFEAGDLSGGGCGDPIVVSATDGYRRPFPDRAHALTSDLAWAPNGTALYGIRRPTLDARGAAYTDKLGPGTVLRWDTATGAVTELPAGCEDCSRLFVSPDGTHVAAEGAGVVRLWDADRGWRELTSDGGLLGWADDRSIVLSSGRVDLDGGSVVRWDPPETARHFSTGPLLSRDGTTIAAMAMSSDLKHDDVILIDVRDGSTRVIWSPLIGRDCELTPVMDRRGCLEHGYAMPGPDTVSWSPRVAAWAPDGSAVLILDPNLSETAATLRVVSVDGSARAPVSARVASHPDLVWLPATAP